MWRSPVTCSVNSFCFSSFWWSTDTKSSQELDPYAPKEVIFQRSVWALQKQIQTKGIYICFYSILWSQCMLFSLQSQSTSMLPRLHNSLGRTSDVLPCYLWTRLCSCDYCYKTGMQDFLFFLNSGCIFFPNSSISCWVEKAQFHPGFPTLQCESVSQDTVTPAAVGGICFCNLSSEQKNFLDLYAYNCNFHCKWKFILGAKGRWVLLAWSHETKTRTVLLLWVDTKGETSNCNVSLPATSRHVTAVPADCLLAQGCKHLSCLGTYHLRSHQAPARTGKQQLCQAKLERMLKVEALVVISRVLWITEAGGRHLCRYTVTDAAGRIWDIWALKEDTRSALSVWSNQTLRNSPLQCKLRQWSGWLPLTTDFQQHLRTQVTDTLVFGTVQTAWTWKITVLYPL